MRAAWDFASSKMMSGQYDLVILDQINYAHSATKCLTRKKWQRRLRERPEMVHVILTGRNAHASIVDSLT